MDYVEKHLTNTVLRTSSTFDKESGLLLGVMGIAGESGELVDYIKKVQFQGHELNLDRVVEELGDLMWYVQYLMDNIGVTLEEVLERNSVKLELRYPNGFTVYDSLNRKV